MQWLNTDSTEQMIFHCQYYSSGNNLSPNLWFFTAREVHAVQMVIMFVCFIVYNESTALSEKCVALQNSMDLTFKGRMLDISNAVHAWSFSALMVFTWARKPNKPIVGAPQQGLVFVRSDGGQGFSNIYAHTWPSGISWGSERPDTVDHCLRLKHRTSMT